MFILEMLLTMVPHAVGHALVRFFRVGLAMTTFKQTRPHAILKSN
jgi:hypothetical protein